MKSNKLGSKKSKAQAMVEFAIALPVLLLLLYGIIEAGRLIFMYSAIVNASRQAVRYGSTSGIGNGTGNTSEPRFQDCDGIRTIAKNLAFITTFTDAEITLKYDTGPSTGQTAFCTAGATTDATFTKPANNNSRIIVTISKQFVPILPKLVPFVTRTITATSARTILISVPITVATAVPQVASVTTITTDTPDPSKVGELINVTVTVTGGTITPTGTVTIFGDTFCTITLTNGTGSCNSMTFNTPGARTITASYGGDLTHIASTDTETHKVRYPTVLTITADTPDPSLVNAALTSVAVSLTNGGVAFTGTQQVVITGANTNCTITLNNGTGIGSCATVKFTSTGTKTLTATYTPPVTDTDHADSTVSTTHYVLANNQATITEITSHTPNPSDINQAVPVSVKVVGVTTPTGTVSITGADTNCTITLTSGAGTCNVTFTSTGPKTITATYNPDASHTGSNVSVGHTVILSVTTTTITAHDPSPSVIGQQVNLVVTVTGGATTPTGTVTITGADAPCTITLASGTGTCNVLFSLAGSKTLVAAYSGDTLHAPSDNATSPVTHIVTPPIASPVPVCNTVTHGTITKAGNTLSMTITNPYVYPLTTGDGSVTWNHDKGNNFGTKEIHLVNANINGALIWVGGPTNSSVYTQIFTTSATLPPLTTSTIQFVFDNGYDNFDGTEAISINVTTPGCSGIVIHQP